MQTKDPRLVPIRDQTCSLKYSAGPVSRGRNVAIAAARTATIATADAGCTYAPDWLANLTAPLVAGTAQYALGGSCLDPADHTLWDVASAPFFSIKLGAEEPTKSCTARSMAFTKALWERIGGFPEAVLVGEDTIFDFEARRLTAPAFIANAKAIYYPRNTFRAATHQMARYAVSDGRRECGGRGCFAMRRAACWRCWRWQASTERGSAVGGAGAGVVVRLPPRLEVFAAVWGQSGAGSIGVFSGSAVVVAANHVYGLFSTKPQTNKQNR